MRKIYQDKKFSVNHHETANIYELVYHYRHKELKTQTLISVCGLRSFIKELCNESMNTDVFADILVALGKSW